MVMKFGAQLTLKCAISNCYLHNATPNYSLGNCMTLFIIRISHLSFNQKSLKLVFMQLTTISISYLNFIKFIKQVTTVLLKINCLQSQISAHLWQSLLLLLSNALTTLSQSKEFIY